ncbi:MAG TPA: hypothetical protein VF458_22025 [Ktedonobacteraceae bacterium]
MSYDPTQWAPQPPDQPPAQPPATPPAYQAPQPPAQPAYGQPQPPQYPSSVPPTTYAQPGQPAAPAYGQPGSPAQPGYGQPGVPGTPSSPSYPAYGQPGVPSTPSSPSYPAYGQPSSPEQPAYGQPGMQSGPSYPAYGQPGAYGAPADQPPAWGAGVPPGYVPPAPVKKKSPALLITIIVLVVLVIAGGGGYYAYQATRPKPVITITSKYLDGATPVGATSTDGFAVKGTNFSANEDVTFLNDGTPGFPGTVTSDSKGAVTATLTVGAAWTPGFHTITAKDKDGYLTALGVKVEIVTAGTKSTPGPNGAPTDTANITISTTVTAGGSTATSPDPLTVKNGQVCSTKDDGQPHNSSGDASGVAYVLTITETCSGTYQGGKLTYTEMASALKIVYSNGLICTNTKSFVNRHFEGAFSSATAVSGIYSTDALTLNCNLGVGTRTFDGETGTWTGNAVAS